MNQTANDSTVVHKQAKLFLVEPGEHYRVREWRHAESENALHQYMQKNEPWRFPLTITEVKHGVG